MADGFGFTNEIRFNANEEFLYVVETTGGCITRLRMKERGALVDREVFGPANLGKGRPRPPRRDTAMIGCGRKDPAELSFRFLAAI